MAQNEEQSGNEDGTKNVVKFIIISFIAIVALGFIVFILIHMFSGEKGDVEAGEPIEGEGEQLTSNSNIKKDQQENEGKADDKDNGSKLIPISNPLTNTSSNTGDSGNKKSKSQKKKDEKDKSSLKISPASNKSESLESNLSLSELSSQSSERAVKRKSDLTEDTALKDSMLVGMNNTA